MTDYGTEVRKPRRARNPSQSKTKPKKASKKPIALAETTVAVKNAPRRIQDEISESHSVQETVSSVEEPSRSDEDEEGQDALRATEEESSSQDDELKARCDRQCETIRILNGRETQLRREVHGAQAAMMLVKKDNAEKTKASNENAKLLTNMTFIMEHAIDPLRTAIESNEKTTAMLQDENAKLKARAEKAEREQHKLKEVPPPRGLALTPRPLSMKLTVLAPSCCAGCAAQRKGVGGHDDLRLQGDGEAQVGAERVQGP